MLEEMIPAITHRVSAHLIHFPGHLPESSGCFACDTRQRARGRNGGYAQFTNTDRHQCRPCDQPRLTKNSVDNLFGRTLDPANPHLTASGFSGGEKAVVTARGSVLGVGTDVFSNAIVIFTTLTMLSQIGASIRIPGVCDGLSTSGHYIPCS